MSLRGWSRVKLGDLFEVKHGFAFKGEFFTESGEHVLLTPGNFIAEGGLKLKGEREKYYSGDIPTDFVLRRNDLLIAMTDLTQNAPILGSTALIPVDARFLHNQRLGKIVNVRTERARTDFLYYLLNTESVRAQIRATASGATVRHTSPSRIYAVEAALPPLSVQDRLVSFLRCYDDLIANCQRRIQLLETMARALYREWFINLRFPGHEFVPRTPSSLGDIPDTWRIARLNDVVVLQRGFDLPKGARIDGEVPVYAATGVTGFHSVSQVNGPTVVTGRSGTIGRVMYVQDDCWPLNTVLWSKAFPQSEPLYAYYLLETLDLKSYNSGAAVPTLNRNDIAGLPALLPPRELQAEFQKIAGGMHLQVHLLSSTVENLRATRDLLLPRLMSGQLTLPTD